MLISVIYPNGKHDMVKDYLLEQMINRAAIIRFRRSSGWVDADAQNIRGRKKNFFYEGPKRRKEDASEQELIDIF